VAPLVYPFTSISGDPTAPGGIMIRFTTSIPVKWATVYFIYAGDGNNRYGSTPLTGWSQLASSYAILMSYTDSGGNPWLLPNRDCFYYISCEGSDGNWYETPAVRFTSPPLH
jgi:hypothetical protein